MHSYVLTLRCVDGPGITHSITGALLARGANILDQAQFTEPSTNQFVMRAFFETIDPDTEAISAAVREATARFGSEVSVRKHSEHRRALIMVSKQDHCLLDLLYRHSLGELHLEIPVIISNHEDCRPIAERHEIPFVYLPVTPETKLEQEARLLELIAEHSIDVVVLARYMQVLSDSFCSAMSGRVINIHHSFLPGFKGAKPYHQAFDRGVKLIGATAHFVTADLDEGPIIDQDVARVSHAHSAEDLARIGRDIERLVLSRAMELYAEDRVILTGSRTVVFA